MTTFKLRQQSTASTGHPNASNAVITTAIRLRDTNTPHRARLLLIRRRQYRSIFIRLAVVASQICEITRNSEKIQTYSSSRSSKVIGLLTSVRTALVCVCLTVHNCGTQYNTAQISSVLSYRQLSLNRCPFVHSFIHLLLHRTGSAVNENKQTYRTYI